MSTNETQENQIVEAVGIVNVDVLDPQVVEARRQADESYDRLRQAVGAKFTEALTARKIIVTERPTVVGDGGDGPLYSYGPVDFGHWHTCLPEAAKKQFQCSHCLAAWSLLSSTVVLNDDGSVTYPLVEALKECEDDPIVALMFQKFPDVTKAVENIANRRAQLLPCSGLPIQHLFEEKDDKGYQHFFAGTRDAIRTFNKGLRTFADINHVQTLFTKIMAKRLHPTILEKIFQYVELKLPDVRGDTALTRAKEVVDLVKKVREVEAAYGRGFLYLWSQILVRENGWMTHIYGSILGIVMDAAVEMDDVDSVEMSMLRVKELLSHATSGENYKNKVAPASEQSLDGTMKFLTANNFEGSLSRRLMPIEEIPSVFWISSKPTAEEGVQEETTLTPLQQARARLKKNNDSATGSIAKLDEILGKHVTKVETSITSFIENIGNYATLALSHRVQSMFPVFVTGPAEEGNHDELLNFDKGIHPHAHLMQPAQPMAYQTVASMAEVMNPDLPFPNELPVMAFFKSQRIPTEPENYVLHLENVGYNFQQMMLKHGSCIMGSSVRSEHFGQYSRAIVDLSRNIPMNVDAGKSAAGGVFMRLGMVFNAVRKDGGREEITLTSLK